MATGQQQNPYRVRQVRRDLARVLTVQRERGPVAAGGKA
jgi:ribosomal protein L29